MTELSVQSHYSVLDLPSSATHDDIVRSYSAAVRHCHPDFLKPRNAKSMGWAAGQFKRLKHAHDVLINPDRRRRYDQESGDVNYPILYSSSYGYIYAANDLPRPDGDYPLEYDEAWSDFISLPLGWTERDLASISVWDVVRWGTLIAVVVTVVLLFGQSSSEEIYRFMSTTRSAPTIESGIPITAATVGVLVAFTTSFVLMVRAGIAYPYSIVHSVKFKRYMVDRIASITLALIYIGVIAGAVIGHFLF